MYAITVEVPVRGTFVSSKEKTELLSGIARLHGQPTDATVQRIVMSPGEGPNWHTHAGPVTVMVKSGNFTVVWDFGNVHHAFNPGPGTTEVWAFYVIPKMRG